MSHLNFCSCSTCKDDEVKVHTPAHDSESLHVGVKLQNYLVPSAFLYIVTFEIVYQRITVNGLSYPSQANTVNTHKAVMKTGIPLSVEKKGGWAWCIIIIM